MKLSDEQTDIGCMLLKMGVLTKEELHMAVCEQAEKAPHVVNGHKSAHLGQLLVDMRLISVEDRDLALKYQRDMRGGKGLKVLFELIEAKLPVLS